MNRIDTKFAFNENFLPELLDLLKPYYNCLQIENKQIANYQTLYYDTSDLMLYYKHHNGSLNRYKVRQRTYLDSNLCFLEVKFKNNKGRTIKERIKQNEISTSFNFEDFEFLNKKDGLTELLGGLPKTKKIVEYQFVQTSQGWQVVESVGQK